MSPHFSHAPFLLYTYKAVDVQAELGIHISRFGAYKCKFHPFISPHLHLLDNQILPYLLHFSCVLPKMLVVLFCCVLCNSFLKLLLSPDTDYNAQQQLCSNLACVASRHFEKYEWTGEEGSVSNFKCTCFVDPTFLLYLVIWR